MKAALISVSDRTGLPELATALTEAGYTLLTTSGSKKALDEAGIKSFAIEEYTGQKEILDGRVKTLHPKIHAGILAKRSNPEHLKQLEAEGIYKIDIAVVNLYPFLKKVAESEPGADLVEFIDIGGPTMIRAAAKNFAYVLPLIDPMDYTAVISELNAKKELSIEFRKMLAAKVFSYMASYDLAIANYLSKQYDGVVLEKVQTLRYGENAQQQASFYKARNDNLLPWKQLQGKELSYNNLLDVDAVQRIAASFAEDNATAIIVKHGNPCGVAIDKNCLAALKRAKQCDPRSHFGGVIAFNREVDQETAREIGEDFAEIVLAPSFSKEAQAILQAKKALRLIVSELNSDSRQEIRKVFGGYLMQTPDVSIADVRGGEVVTERKPTTIEMQDAAFAWKVCAHVKSNSITIVKDQMLVGVGAGQMSRIDSVEVALSKSKLHGHDLNGAVAASDAFFPFPDSVETLAKSGIKCIVAPNGAKKDSEVIEAANKSGITLIFMSERHFRH